jgi:hypothetical protein
MVMAWVESSRVIVDAIFAGFLKKPRMFSSVKIYPEEDTKLQQEKRTPMLKKEDSCSKNVPPKSFKILY